MADVAALGEILVDFTSGGISENGSPVFIANPGGAPGNLLVALSRLGKDTTFIGAVGKDKFGMMLEDTLKDYGVSTAGMVHSDIHTTLAFVHINESGDRSFSFCRNPGADVMLSSNELKPDLITGSKIFHVGSLSMTNNPSREATREALKIAKSHKITISCDPNLRLSLWKSQEEAKERIKEILSYADIAKLSEEELEFLTGTNKVEKGASEVLEQYNMSLLFITAGSKGSYCFSEKTGLFEAGMPIKAIDTTGCGDAFFAGILYKVLDNNMQYKGLTEKMIKDLLVFGNAMGAYVARKQGGIPALPDLPEINKFILDKNRKDHEKMKQ
ncbi:carbohydrate kinase [Gracilibacillus oryzae]|uniref:Carbohydrate kinase n=1 Tax=Gracilibacillus oryzae TaxID=1672701 RepID=A0A7C8GQA7_9BACI|nr:carbohydrate kinase [Gracilibacillus oryzae]KAB8125930.1 carbohydrate kinase [Gracilibacillus oryzae]